MMIKRILVLGVLAVSLAGCGEPRFLDLESYAEEVKKRPVRDIEPLPEPKPYLPFSYTATFMRDPFQNQDTIIRPVKISGKKCELPDPTRPKGPLEDSDIGSFTMVGTIENDKEHYALVRGINGILRAKVGDYIGLNHGEIRSINDFGMEVIEKIPDGSEGCRERPYSLELKN